MTWHRKVVVIEYEDNCANCTEDDVVEALDHLRDAHGCKVSETSMLLIDGERLAAQEKLRRIQEIIDPPKGHRG